MATILRKQRKSNLFVKCHTVNDGVANYMQVLIFVNLPKAKKSKYIENKILFFL